MRFRMITDTRQFVYDFEILRTFVGPRTFDHLLQRRIEMISTLGIISDVSQMAFEIEIGLKAIGKNPRKFMECALNHRFHVATDFIIGVAQIITHASERSRRTLQGQLIDGLRSAGLFKLHHELRVATEFSKNGFDVDFSGLETEGCQDFLVRKSSSEYEIEAKAFEHDAGANVNLRTAEHFFRALRETDLGNVDAEGVSVLNICLDVKLPTNEGARQDLVEACKRAFLLPFHTKVSIPFGGSVSRVLRMPKETPTERIVAAMQAMHRRTGIIGFCNNVAPRFVVHLISSVSPDFSNVLLDRAKDAAKRQFSKKRPAIIWLHPTMPAEIFYDLETKGPKNLRFFSEIAKEVLRSESRSHLLQLVFSGGSFSATRNGLVNSRYHTFIFNSSACRFSDAPPLPGGTII